MTNSTSSALPAFGTLTPPPAPCDAAAEELALAFAFWTIVAAFLTAVAPGRGGESACHVVCSRVLIIRGRERERERVGGIYSADGCYIERGRGREECADVCVCASSGRMYVSYLYLCPQHPQSRPH
jgi:hypothetical protein